MFLFTLDIYQSTALSVLILAVGLFVVKRSETLRKFCIPAAVVGGLIFAVVNLILHGTGLVDFSFDETMKNVFMMAFFCSVGFMASFRMLKAGGRLVAILLVLVGGLIVIQDIIGPVVATAFGYDPKLGLAIGSISLVGGHGTAASYGDLLVNKYGITGADTVAIAAATFGLAISGFIGGPLAERRIERHDLKPSVEDVELSQEEEERTEIDNNRFLYALALIILCVGAGTYIGTMFSSAGITVPVYLGAMILAMIIRNIADMYGYDLPLREISTLGWISLSVFLSMALMVMKLWQIADLAVALIIALALQTVAVMLFAYHLIFRFTGKDYESAALLTATCGFGMGATPNAVANMEALFSKFGNAPTAYFVVPLVGSVFIDFVNTGVLTVLLNIL